MHLALQLFIPLNDGSGAGEAISADQCDVVHLSEPVDVGAVWGL